MPVYQFKCDRDWCKNEFSVELAIAKLDEYNIYCPECGNHRLKRVYTAPGVVFKGKGWASRD